MKKAFTSIKEEMADHLESINQNTNEIQSNYEFLCEIDSKIEKLNEKIEEIQMFLFPELASKKNYAIDQLTEREQEIFLVLYASEDTTLTFHDIGRKTGLPSSLVKEYVKNLIKKGVPIIKTCSNDQISVSLGPDFKALQAKENIAKINESIAKTI